MCFCTNLIQQLFSWLAIISPFHDNKHITTIAFRVTTSLFFSSSCSRRVTDIRNIQVPEREFSRSSHSVSPVRPKTAPTRRTVRPRSPSHPNYKEEAYLQSTVVLRYVGHTDHYTRQRYTYRVLQTIQIKLILLCVWAEPAILGSAKTALKFKYEI
jgi:hypothetical protein